MAVHEPGIFSNELRDRVKSSKILVVGAGGIGCELLKNLVLTGFEDLEVIDLDTIDVSNLNRQFLFHKQHVGRSKSEVARESALRFNPKANIVAYHDSVTLAKYNVKFYEKFTLVMNALDNRAARNHVNRMCLASNIPLIESGTAGYLGQVTVIKKSETECYECQPKPTQKTFPGCTIRNTPSEPIHCIVWAKHLFNQLFGEIDADDDVSPDSSDPEQVGNVAEEALSTEKKPVVSTRSWALSHNYDARKLFHKLFIDDIQYLLSMDKLWQSRKAPTPSVWHEESEDFEEQTSLIQDQRLWSPALTCKIFDQSINSLKMRFNKLKEGDHLVWDKDDEDSLDFVTACANIRARIFGIPEKSRFDVKSMAGNIIPAIATTNAIIAGLIVLQALKILSDLFQDCRTVFLNRKPNPKKRLLVPCHLDKPNPKCYVCAEKPEVTVLIRDADQISVKTLDKKILQGALNMMAPDVHVEGGAGTILISSDPDEIEFSSDLPLSHFKIQDGTQLFCDDFQQSYELRVTIRFGELEDGVEFLVVGDPEKLKAEQEESRKLAEKRKIEDESGEDKKEGVQTIQDDDDIFCIEESEEKSNKRKADDVSNGDHSSKKVKLDGDDLIVL